MKINKLQIQIVVQHEPFGIAVRSDCSLAAHRQTVLKEVGRSTLPSDKVPSVWLDSMYVFFSDCHIDSSRLWKQTLEQQTVNSKHQTMSSHVDINESPSFNMGTQNYNSLSKVSSFWPDSQILLAVMRIRNKFFATGQRHLITNVAWWFSACASPRLQPNENLEHAAASRNWKSKKNYQKLF